MSVLAFPSSAAARNFQDLSHIFRDFRRPVPLFLARMEVVSRTAPRPVGLMRVAGLTPLVACLGRAGAPLTRLLQRVRLPARLFDRPEALIPTCQAARFIDEAASVEGFENVARLSNRNRQICGLGTWQVGPAFGAIYKGIPGIFARRAPPEPHLLRVHVQRPPACEHTIVSPPGGKRP